MSTINNYLNNLDLSKSHHRAFISAVLNRLLELDPTALDEGSDLRSIWVSAVTIPPAVGTTWEEISTVAAKAGAKYPELLAAQWALESGWGMKVSGKNNYWGIKGKGTLKDTWEFIDGKEVKVKAEFKDFASLEEAVAYLVDRWYKDYQDYKGVNNAPSRNAAAKELVKQGYATDPAYADKLIQLMDENAPLAAMSVDKEPAKPQGAMQIPGAVGPKKRPADFGFGEGDSHLVVNDITETMKAFNHKGEALWEIPCLARGQGADDQWDSNGEDTPPGLYKLGQLYNDYERVGNNPAYELELMQYGWMFFDLVELEGQEVKHGRAGVGIHGGGSACGWPGAWAPKQTLYPTLGCVRIANIDLLEKILPLYKQGTVYVSVYQEA